MASITHGGTIATGAQPADVYNLIDTATVSGIVNADCAAGMALVDTKLATISTAGKVTGAAITSLTGVPSGAGALPTANLPTEHWIAGSVVQVVNTITGAVATGSTAMQFIDTIPPKTEGDEYMTLAITPKSATNKLVIDVVANVGCSNGGQVTAALFQDTTTNSLAVADMWCVSGNTINIKFTHYMVAGTTSATTFKVRMGTSNGGTLTFNGSGGGRKYGGVMASSITITEIVA